MGVADGDQLSVEAEGTRAAGGTMASRGRQAPGLERGSLGLSGSSQPEAHVQCLQLTVEERYKHCSESKVKTKPEVVMHTCNPNTWQSEAGR